MLFFFSLFVGLQVSFPASLVLFVVINLSMLWGNVGDCTYGLGFVEFDSDVWSQGVLDITRSLDFYMNLIPLFSVIRNRHSADDF